MAVTAKLYNSALTALANKEIDWGSDTIKVMLCTSSYTPSQTTHDYKNDVTGEVTGTGYTAGGATLSSKTEAFTGQTKTFDAADVSWPSSTLTARYAVIYDDTPSTTATKPLIAYIDFGQDVSSETGALTIEWGTSGIFTITVG